jgi:cellulose synthase (UDP-forming)
MCGTNMAIRREALLQAGGMAESIAEDFVTGVFLHQRGWKSVYVAEVLAEGLAPEDFLSYTKQQFRWARGALDVLFRYNLLFRPGLTLGQRIQYLSSVSYFLSGSVVLMNILLPLLFLYFGLVPVRIDTMLLAAVFVPYMLLTVGVLASTSNRRFSFRALSFSLSSFWIHIRALWSAATGQKASFDVTSKKKISGNFLGLVWPHIMYVCLVAVGIVYAVVREGLSASVVNNVAWALFNVGMIVPYILAAAPEGYARKNLSRLYEMMFIPEKVAAARLRVVSAVDGIGKKGTAMAERI